MRLLAFLIMWLAADLSTAGQSMYEQNIKKVHKELSAWNPSFSRLDHLTTAEGREFFNVLDESGSKLANLVLSSAEGRFERFDLMILFDGQNQIKRIRILRYRSEFGSEISNKKWLEQFYQQPDSIFIFRKNIDAISGATYSVQGLINEINRILLLLSNQHPAPSTQFRGIPGQARDDTD